MSEQRKKRRRKTSLTTNVGGNAAEVGAQGAESVMAVSGNESLANTEQLMEEILDSENLEAAAHRVMQNKGAAGGGRMTGGGLPAVLAANW